MIKSSSLQIFKQAQVLIEIIRGTTQRVSLAKMTSISVRPEDRLEGVSNFNMWKTRILDILEEHDLDQFVTSEVEIPTSNVGRTTFKKNQAKEKRIIFDFVKDSIITVLTPLKTAKECFDTLVNM